MLLDQPKAPGLAMSRPVHPVALVLLIVMVMMVLVVPLFQLPSSLESPRESRFDVANRDEIIIHDPSTRCVLFSHITVPGPRESRGQYNACRTYIGNLMEAM